MRTLLAILVTVFAGFAAAQDISLENGSIRQPMPGRTITAGYFTLHNATTEEQRLVAVSSPMFAKIELHQHSHQNGMMKMEQVEFIAIPAQQSVVLQPGGLHLMLFEPDAALAPGQMLPLELKFANGSTLSAEVPVVAMPKR